jgi:hypothetical protein
MTFYYPDVLVLEDKLIAKFKLLNPKVARLFVYAETLVGAGVLSVDDVAKYVNDVLSASSVAWHYEKEIFSDSFIVLQLMNTNMTASKAAQILSDANITASRAAQILNNTNMTVNRAAQILNDTNMTVSKAAQILGNANITASKATQILSNANMTANKAQSILYSMVEQGFYDKLLDIITLDAPNASYTSNTSLSSGVNRYRNLSIASGVTLTLGAEPGVVIAYSITNSGTIASGWIKGAGGVGGCGAGDGGGGRGSVAIFANSVTVGTVTSNGANGFSATAPSYWCGGGAGGAGNFWLIQGDSVPYGGNGGGSYGGSGQPNGGGGGGAGARYGGAGGSATTATFTNAQSLLTQFFKSVCDWWLVNVVGKTPSSTISIPSLGGSGGGGGYAASGVGDAGGGGGGGGGQIIIYGTNAIAGSVQAKGGNGGGRYSGGGLGGGGGGGIVYVLYKSLSGTFTYDVGGGAGANAGGTGVFRAISV